MTVRPLRLLGDPVLRTPSEQVTRFDDALARYCRAIAEGVDLEQRPVTVAGTGELARCLQHETDHTRGELYIDKLTGAERRRVMREIRQHQAAA